MTEPQARLWETLKQTPLGPAEAVVTFEDKLIQQTQWPRPLAKQAIDEYRRYLLLAATAGHAVSPSPVVDEVWHLHLLYTRHYWKTLCPQILGTDLHHEPATGTANNRSSLNDDYAKTLVSYDLTFGEPPPELIWPKRPRAGRFVRIDLDRNVVLPRQAVRTAVACVTVAVLAIAIVMILVLLSR